MELWTFSCAVRLYKSGYPDRAGMFIKLITFLLYFSVMTHADVKVCPLEASCGQVDESSAICRLDEERYCIRKYASKCHMDIEACKAGKNYNDYSDVYCQMETYICEETPSYERWTVFFGHVND